MILDFNISMKEGAYQERPTPRRSNIDRAGDMQNTLLRALGQITDAAVGGMMEKAKKDAKAAADANENAALEFINEGTLDAGLRASNDGYNAERSAQEEQEQSAEIMQRDLDRHDALIDPVTGAISEQNYAAYADAIKSSTKELGRVKAKAEQQGKHFDYKSAVAQVYMKATKQFGAAAAAAAFETLHGKQPLKFLTDDVIEAEQAAKQKATEAHKATIDDVAKALGIMPIPGETSQEKEARTLKAQETFMMLEEDQEKLEFFNSQTMAVDERLRKPVESRFAANMIGKSYLDLGQTLAGFDPVTATPEERQSYLQRIQDYRSLAGTALNTLVVNDTTTRAYAMAQIESNVKVFEDMVLGKTNASVMEGMNKLRASQALYELGEQVPNFHKLVEVNKLGALISSNSLFNTGFTQLVQDTSGKAIARALISGDISALAASPPSAEDWRKINLRILEMSKAHPAFAEVISKNSVKILNAAVDPITGAWKDPNAALGLLTLYGSKEYFQYIQPKVAQELGNTRYKDFIDDMNQKVMETMIAQVSRSQPLTGAMTRLAKEGSPMIVEMTDDGNIILGYEDKDGSKKYFLDQDKGDLNAARNAMAAAVRANAHFNGSTSYPEYLAIMLEDKYKLGSYIPVISNSVYEARLKEMKSKQE